MTTLVGNRVRRFDDFNPIAGNRVTVTRDDETSERPRPLVFYGFSHRRRCFACADHNSTPLRRRRAGREERESQVTRRRRLRRT